MENRFSSDRFICFTTMYIKDCAHAELCPAAGCIAPQSSQEFSVLSSSRLVIRSRLTSRLVGHSWNSATESMHFIYHFASPFSPNNEKEVCATRVGLGVRWENLADNKETEAGDPKPTVHSQYRVNTLLLFPSPSTTVCPVRC